ncbi:MAG: PAS domain-containing protein, partial [Chloroflexota bacterium]
MAESRRILIVDHEHKAVVDMGRVLSSAGYEVLEAATGLECLRVAREQHPHLILVDEALSDISGIDLVKQIKRDAELSRAYVALLSREGTQPAIQARGLESGADACIVRTFVTREFLARVEALLRRQAAADTLRESVQQYRATFDAMSDAVYLVDLQHRIVDCNLAMARFLSKPRGEIVGGRCHELVHGTGKPIPACLGYRVRETRRRESLVVPMDERWLQVDVDPLLDPAGAVIGSVHVLRDITEQRHMEQALEQTQAEQELHAEEHRSALAKATQALLTEVASRERTHEVLLGTQAQLELHAREVAELTTARESLEESLQRVQRELRTVAAHAADLVYTWDLETGQVHLLSDSAQRFAGKAAQFPATIGELQGMNHPADRARVEDELAEHVRDGQPWSTEYRVVHQDGQVAHWAISAAALDQTQAREWLVAVRDVTALRRAEKAKERLTAQLHLQQKMGALRRLAAGVADEFNRLLAMMLGQVELVLARLEPAHPLQADLKAIQKVTRQAGGLVQQLLAFGGRAVLQAEAVDVNEVIEECEPRLRRSVSKAIELQFVLAAELQLVFADAGMLSQVVLNLAARAVAAMPQGGALRIHTAGVTIPPTYLATNPAARPGDYVRLTLAHSGAELPADLEGVFEPRLASAESGAGYELGLAMAYALVQQLGGFIEVTQQVAQETVWDVYLPAWLGEEQGSAVAGAGEWSTRSGGAGEWSTRRTGAEE